MDSESSFDRVNSSAFVRWASHDPALFEHIRSSLLIVANTHECRSVVDLVWRRDALNSLYTTALDGGFTDVATTFYHAYEACCQALVQYAL